MKKYALIFIIASIVPLKAYHPEVWIYVDDYFEENYWLIKATAISYIYDENYNYTENFSTALEYAPDPSHTVAGFAFVGIPTDDYDYLAYSKYRLDFSRSDNDPVLFSFYIDFRTCLIDFYDIDLRFYRDANGIISVSWKRTNSAIENFISNGEELNYWEMVSINYNDSCFYANIYPHNYVSYGSGGFDDFGELYIDDDAYTSGVDLFITLKGNTHNFLSYSNPTGVENYLFRNWNTTTDHYLNPKYMRVENNTDIIAYLYPTQPLTVTNNLEGGTGGTYTVTWDKQPSEPQTLNSGESYYAFEFNLQNLDRFTLEALNFPALSTDWYFQNWNTGSTNNTISDYQVTAPASFTANYKGNLTSNQTDGFSSNGQRKIVRDNSGYYHCVYSSLGKVWYTKSTTTDFNGSWTQDTEIFTGTNTKNPSIDVNGNDIAIVAEQADETSTTILLYRSDIASYDFVSYNLDAGYFGNSYPVVSYTDDEIFMIYKLSATSPFKYRRYYHDNSLNQWVWTLEADLPYSTSDSKYPSIAGNKTDDDVYITWQEGTTQIKYLYSHRQDDNRTFLPSNFQTVSTNSGYTSNTNPSISLSAGSPIVSWTASRKEKVLNKTLGKEEALVYVYRALIRSKATNWGDFKVLGSEVNYTNNNSSASLTGETVIAFSQSEGSTSKWIKRVGGYYSELGTLSHNGLQVNVSNGTGILDQKAMVFNTSSLPYPINRSTTSFGSLQKIASDTTITYGRTGIVGKQEVEICILCRRCYSG